MRILIGCLVAFSFLFSYAPAADDGSWFDMEKCAMCKNLMDDPDLMHNMSWNHYEISNGLVSITKVDPAYLNSYKKARVQMNEIGERMAKGEKFDYCNMCNSLGGLFQDGAKWESVESDNVFVSIVTSDNPQVVEQIHKWGERTTKEMLAMEQSAQNKHTH